MAIVENDLEEICIDWLIDNRYEYFHSDEISYDGANQERAKFSEVVLKNRLLNSISELNENISQTDILKAVDKLANYRSQSIVDGNKEVYDWIRNGVPVDIILKDGTPSVIRLNVINFKNPELNNFLAVRQFTVHGNQVRRPDIVCFVNGLPLIVIELKNPAEINADIESAYNQIQDYKSNIPQLFYFNLCNIISDGTVARYGSLTADFSRHSRWRLLNGKKVANTALELEILLNGLLSPQTIIQFLNSYVAFGGADGGATFKVIAQWHQFHGVNRAVVRAKDALLKKDGKGGVVWFTQGSGKSLLALFYVMALRDEDEFKNPTIVVVTDRNDLDSQLFNTFADSSWSLRATPKQADSREELKEMLSSIEAGGIFFTTIQKFAPENKQASVDALCERGNVIVITDEAHRTQYGFKAEIDTATGKTKYGLAKYMRDALPKAIYLGMTGTPISFDDKDTEAVFGSYVDIYDMQAAQEDGAVVPVSYESRIIELKFNEAERQALLDEFIENTESESELEQTKTASRYTRLEELAIADGRLKTLAADLVEHWDARKESMKGKAMVVAVSRPAAIALYDEIVAIRQDWHDKSIEGGKIKIVMTSSASDPVVFHPHRTSKEDRKRIEKRFKDENDPLEIVIVRDMWLTGFDAPPVHTLYIDKPMQGHNLMQAIARTNRVWSDKPGGLVVDYIGIGEELKKAIKQYTKDSGSEREPIDTSGQALTVMMDTLDVIRKEFFHSFNYSGFEIAKKALSLLGPAMEHILQLDPKPDGKIKNKGLKAYLDQVAKLTTAQALAGTNKMAMKYREEIAFFQAVRVSLIKLTRGNEGGKSRVEKEAALRQLVARGVLVEGVNDIFGTLGLKKPDISLLDEKFLEQVRAMPTKNLAAELLERLIADQIKSRSAKNAMKGKEFTAKLEEAILKYQNRAITTVQVIEALINLAKEINADKPLDGMTEDEFAFYQALSTNESAVRDLGHPVLRALALELTDKLRKSATINWQNRQSSRARMMAMVKVLLKKHRYPPDGEVDATEKIINQAELLADSWAFE